MISLAITGLHLRGTDSASKDTGLALGFDTTEPRLVASASGTAGVEWTAVQLTRAGAARVTGRVNAGPEAHEVGRADTGREVGDGVVYAYLRGWAWWPRYVASGAPAKVNLDSLSIELGVAEQDGRWWVTVGVELRAAEDAGIDHEVRVELGWGVALAAPATVTVRSDAAAGAGRVTLAGPAGDVAPVALLAGVRLARPSAGRTTLAAAVRQFDPATGACEVEARAEGPAPDAAVALTVVLAPAATPPDREVLSTFEFDAAGAPEQQLDILAGAGLGAAAGTPPHERPKPKPSAWPQGSRAGFKRAALPLPHEKWPLVGHGFLNSGNTDESRTTLYTRAMALQDEAGERLIVIVNDLWTGSRYLHEAVGRRLATSVGVGVDRVLLMGTHTHTGPAGWVGNTLFDFFAPHAPDFRDEYAARLADAIAENAQAAVAAMVPATVRLDQAKLWGVARNRSFLAFQLNHHPGDWNAAPAFPGHDPKDGLTPSQMAVDPRLPVLSFFDSAGKRIGRFTCFAMHNTAVGHHEPWKYDSDWTGRAARALEGDDHDDAVALVSLSCAGDQTPVPPDEGPSPGQPAATSPELAAWIAGQVAAKLRALPAGPAGAAPIQLRVGYRDWWTAADDTLGDPAWNNVPLGRLAAWRFGATALGGAVDGYSFLHPWAVGDAVIDPDSEADPLQRPKAPALGLAQTFLKQIHAFSPAPVHALHSVELAGHLFVTVPGEPTVWAAHEIATEVSKRTGKADVTVLGYTGDYAGYFVTEAEFAAQRYEGASTLWGKQTTRHLAVRLAELAAQPGAYRAQARVPGFPTPGGAAAQAPLLPPPGLLLRDGTVSAWVVLRDASAPTPGAWLLEVKRDGERAILVPVELAAPVELTRLDNVGGSPNPLLLAHARPAGDLHDREFVFRFGELDIAAVPLDGPPLELDLGSALRLRRLLDQAPDGGRALLGAMFPNSTPDEARAALEAAVAAGSAAVWPLHTVVKLDPAQLAAFRAAWPGALAGVTDAELESVHFQTKEDWNSYGTAPGAAGWHVFGSAMVMPRYWMRLNLPAALTYPTRPGQDPAQSALEIGIFADFGANLHTVRSIGRQICDAGLPYAFHLGDVYYSGLKSEFASSFYWQEAGGAFTGPLAPLLGTTELFMLSGNHEAYAKGTTFHAALDARRSAFPALQRQDAECFRLLGDGFQIIGIDTMWSNWQGGSPRVHAHLDEKTRALLDTWLKESPGLTILLTSDHPWDHGDAAPSPLYQDVFRDVGKGRVDLWFWGNVHYAALYEVKRTDPALPGFVGACVGHGGYPFDTQSAAKQRAPGCVGRRWLDQSWRFAPYDGLRPDVGLNGWVRMGLRREGTTWRVRLRWLDWIGREIAVTELSKPAGGEIRIDTMRAFVAEGGAMVLHDLSGG